jgi:hypothetical protein
VGTGVALLPLDLAAQGLRTDPDQVAHMWVGSDLRLRRVRLVALGVGADLMDRRLIVDLPQNWHARILQVRAISQGDSERIILTTSIRSDRHRR